MAKKKEKVTYIYDGRTIADMSAVSGPRLNSRPKGLPRSSAKEVWETYWAAVKMMFVPMLVVIVGLLIVYMILSVIFLVM
jgi:hypothetical protein